MIDLIVMKETSRQYKWQQEKKAKGLCISCGKKANGKRYCRKHKKLATERARKWRAMIVLEEKDLLV